MPIDLEITDIGAAQAASLADLSSAGLADAALNALIALHNDDDGDPAGIVVQPVFPPDGQVSQGLLAVANHLLVWERDHEAAIRALGDIEVVESVKVTPRVVQLRLRADNRDADGRQLYAAVERVRDAGLRVSFEHALAQNDLLAPVADHMTVKGDRPPVAPGAYRLPERPPGRWSQRRPRPLQKLDPRALLDGERVVRWSRRRGEVTVAVIDSGVSRTARTDGWLVDVLGDHDPTAPGDPQLPIGHGAGHGTAVAGTVQLVAPDVQVVSYRALYKGLGSEVNVARAIMQASMRGADVINLSLGMTALARHLPLALEDALFHLPDDVLVVAAAGNDGSFVPAAPAIFDRVIAVGAMDVDDTRADYSNRGHHVDVSTCGTVAAPFIPGTTDSFSDPHGNVLGGTTFADPNPVAILTGTSFASPIAAGRLASLRAEGLDPEEAVASLKAVGRAEPDFGIVVTVLEQ